MKNDNVIDVNLKRDLQKITNLIQEYIDETYLSHIRNQIYTYKRQCEEEPCKESQLLQAMVPFLDDQNQNKCSNMIQLITYSQMIQKMLPNEESANSLSLMRGSENKKPVVDYMQQVLLTLFLYKAIVWAEEYSEK